MDQAGTEQDWLARLGITDRRTGEERAHAAWHLLIETGRSVLGWAVDFRHATEFLETTARLFAAV